jgi:hypothetical protein
MPLSFLIAVWIAARLGPGLESLPQAAVRVNAAEHRIVIELPAVDLPAGTPMGEVMVSVPLCQVLVPVSASLHSSRVEVLDDVGQLLPQDLLHHFNLTDPYHRELFLPISLHLFAASKETPRVGVPRLLFGLPVERGQRLIAGAMVANSSAIPHHGVRVRLVLDYVPAGRPWPLYRTFPWDMDVAYPLGHTDMGIKSFDLPPGRTVRSWEASPAIGGTILGLGGHLHDYGVSLELRDVTTGRVLWGGSPITAGPRVVTFPLARFYNWHRLGLHILPAHRYRVTAVYENPTGQVIHEGGMGAVAGLFVPDYGAVWPTVDTADTLYQADLRATLRSGARGQPMMMMQHASR